jgi:hypothetical protein
MWDDARQSARQLAKEDGMKQVRHVCFVLAMLMIVTASFANEQLFMGFDEVSQTMQAVVRGDAPFHAVIQYEQSNTGGYIGSVDQTPIRPTEQWGEAELSPVDPNRMSDVPDGTRNVFTATASLYNDNEEFLGTLTATDTLYANVDGAVGYYTYQTANQVVLPDTIRASTSFCAHIIHGTYRIPILCDFPAPNGDIPAVRDVEVTVENGCNSDRCNVACEPIDWSLFTWNIRSRANCNISLVITYCNGAGGCICITRSDRKLPVEFSSFQAVAGNGKVDLTWTTRSESDLSMYKVARSDDPDNIMSWQIVATRVAHNTATGATYTVSDEGLSNGRTYYYKLHVVDQAEHQSVYNIDGTTVVQSATPQATVDMPLEFHLGQNFPNPFNNQTSFSFAIPTAERVTLKVYDIMGREVATILNGNMQANSYTINWSAENLATGVYMYTLQAGQYSETKKLLYLK